MKGYINMKKTKQIENIEEMEKLFDESLDVIKQMEKTFKKFNNIQKKIDKLEDYYFSKQWLKDYEDDENNKLPKDLKRGVLSQDGLYNLINDNDEIIKKMNRLLKNYSKD